MQAEIYSITPFDQAIGSTFEYNWSATQRYVELTIRDGSTTSSNIVYQSGQIETNLKQVSVPANSGLQNGQTYYAFIKITDSNGNNNDNYNAGKMFYCRATPEFNFVWNDTETPVTNGKRFLKAFSFSFTVTYSQSDGERLDSWSITLYSSDRTPMSTSGTMYNVPHTTDGGTVSATLSYPFSGFSDSNDYLIRAQGKTQNGISVDTGYVGITSNYSTKSIFAVLQADNIPTEGKIYVHSNIVSSVCKVFDPDGNEIPEAQLGSRGLLYSSDYTNPSDNARVTGNHALILPEGYHMEIDDGFSLGGNFSMSLIFINPIPNKPLATFVNADDRYNTYLYYRVGKYNSDWAESPTGEQGCFELIVDGKLRDIYVSDIFNRVADDERVGVVIVRDDNRFHLISKTGFRLTDVNVEPVESYATSEKENIG